MQILNIQRCQTHLYLMKKKNKKNLREFKEKQEEEQREIYRVEIPVQSWGQQPKKRLLEIKKVTENNKSNSNYQYPIQGFLQIQVSLTEILQLQNFHNFQADIQQSSLSSQQTKHFPKNPQKIYSKQQYLHLQSQNQDLKYLIQKLQVDRTAVLTTNSKLTQQLNKIKQSLSFELQNCHSYYTTKFQHIKSIYQQQLQSIITAFNTNSITNIKLLQQLIEQSQHYYNLYNKESYEHTNTKQQHKKYKEQTISTIQQLQQKIDELFIQNTKIQQQLYQTNIQLDNTTNQHNLQRQQLQQKIQQQQSTIIEQENAINQKQQQINNKQNQIDEIIDKNTRLSSEIDKYISHLNQQLATNKQYENKILGMQFNIQQLKLNLQINGNQLKRNTEEYVIKKEEYQVKVGQLEVIIGELQMQLDQRMEKIQSMQLKVQEQQFQNLQQNQQLALQKNQKQLLQEKMGAIQQQLDMQRKQYVGLQNQFNQYREYLNQLQSKLLQLSHQKSQIQQINKILDNKLNQQRQTNLQERQEMRTQYQQIQRIMQNNADQQKQLLDIKRQEVINQFNQYRLRKQQEVQKYKQKLEEQRIQILQYIDNKNQLELDIARYQQQIQEYNIVFKKFTKVMEQKQQLIDENFVMLMNSPEERQLHNKKQQKTDKANILSALLNSSANNSNKNKNNDNNDNDNDNSNNDNDKQKHSGQQVTLNLFKQILKMHHDKTKSTNQNISKLHQQIMILRKQKAEKQNIMQQAIYQNTKHKQEIQRLKERQQKNNIKNNQLKKRNQQLRYNYQKIKEQLNEIKNYVTANQDIFSLSQTKGKMSQQLLIKSYRTNQDELKFNYKNNNRQDVIDQQNSEQATPNIQNQNKKYVSMQNFVMDQQQKSQSSGIMIDVDQIDQIENELKEQKQQKHQIQPPKQQITTKRIKKKNTLQRRKDAQRQIVPILISKNTSDFNQSLDDDEHQEYIQQPQDTSLPDLKKKQTIKSKKKPINIQIQHKNLESPHKIQVDEEFDRRGELYETNGNFSLGLTEQQFRNSQQQLKNVQNIMKKLEKKLKNKQFQIKQKEKQCQQQQEQIRKLFDQLVVTRKSPDNFITITKAQKKPDNYENQRALTIQFLQKKQLQYSEKQKDYGQRIQQLKIENEKLIIEIKKSNMQIESKNDELLKVTKNLQEQQNSHKNKYGSSLSKIIEQQLDQSHKRIIQLNRSSNNFRLQKQTIQDQLKIKNKKYTELERTKNSLQHKIQSLTVSVQSGQHAANKLKYTLENKQYQLEQASTQIKKLQQKIYQIQQTQQINTQKNQRTLYQRNQINSKIDELTDKLKESQKDKKRLRQKYEQLHENKSMKNRTEQKQRVKLQIQNNQLMRDNKQLRGQIQIIRRSQQDKNRGIIYRSQQTTSIYKQKLHSYDQQLLQIKHALTITEQQLDQLQLIMNNLQFNNQQLTSQNSTLKQQLNNHYNQTQLLKLNIQQQTNKNKQLQSTIITNINQLNLTINQLTQTKNKLDRQYLMNNKKNCRIEQLQMLNQKYIYQLGNIKKKNIQHEAKKINIEELSQSLKNAQQNIKQLTFKIDLINKQFYLYRQQYVYTESQVNNRIQEIHQRLLQQHHIKMKELAQNIMEQNQQKNSKIQADLLKLYQENSNLKVQVGSKQQNTAEVISKYNQIKGYQEKYKQLLQDNEIIKIKLIKTEGQLVSRSKQLEIIKNDNIYLQNKLKKILQQLAGLNKAFIIQQQTSKTLKIQLSEVETAYRITKQQLNTLIYKNSNNQQSLQTELQNLSAKLLGLQLQNNRIKQREINMTAQYSRNLNRLQTTLKQSQNYNKNLQINNASKQKKQLNTHQTSIKLFQQQLNQSKSQCHTLSNALSTLKKQNNQLANQLANTRQMLTQSEQLYLHEINKLKNQVNDNKQIYQHNLNNLEDQLTALNRELIQEKLKKSNMSQMSMLAERNIEEIQGKYKEKISNKEKIIQQMRVQMFTLSEQANKYKLEVQNPYNNIINKKSQQNISQNQKLLKSQQKTLQQTIISLKQQLQTLTSDKNILQGKVDQKDLQIYALRGQYNTIKQLYQNLQQQVYRHNNSQNQKNIKHVYQQQEQQQQKIQLSVALDIAENRIRTKQKQLEEYINKYKGILLECQKFKIQEEYLKKQNKNIWKDLQNMNQQNSILNKEVREYKSSAKQNLEKWMLERKNREQFEGKLDDAIQEIDLYRKKQEQFHIQNARLMKQFLQISKTLQNYVQIQKMCEKQHGFDLEEFVYMHGRNCIQDNNIQQKQKKIKILKQEIEEMKFLYQRKSIDFEEIRKINLELQLKFEDYQFACEQVDNLRKLCDKLEVQKKNATFQLTSLALKLNNFLESQAIESYLRSKLQSMLAADSYLEQSIQEEK